MRKLRILSLFFAADVGIVWASVYLAYYFRFLGNIPPTYSKQLILYSLLATFSIIALNTIFKLYSRVWRYASIGEMISIVAVLTLGNGLSYLCLFLATGVTIPISIFLLSYETMLILMGGQRFVWRVLLSMAKRNKQLSSRALIIGAGDCGTLIAKELLNSSRSSIRPFAFIDDDPTRYKQRICGLPVLGGRQMIQQVCEKYEIRDIIIAMPSVSRREISLIIDICTATKARLKIIPPLVHLIEGSVSVNEIRDVDVEDLLGREPVRVDLGNSAKYLTNVPVLVTGAGGSIGSELCRQIARLLPKPLILLGNCENEIFEMERELKAQFPRVKLETVIADVKDRERIEDIFDRYRPAVVYHAAAHKHVPLMERNPNEAINNNVFGTRNVADCAHRYGTRKFVLISTDKAVNPTSVMGTTKRMAEMYVQGLNQVSGTAFSVVRFGNVLGSRGSVVPEFKKQIASGGPVQVTHQDMIRYFMTIPESVQLIVQASLFSEGGEIFVLDMGEPVRIVKLAEDMIRLSGFEPYTDIGIVFTGMRPGEKLYEELMSREEGLASTCNERIFVTRVGSPDYEEICRDLDKLSKLDGLGPIAIKRLIQTIVPTYRFEVKQSTAVS